MKKKAVTMAIALLMLFVFVSGCSAEPTADSAPAAESGPAVGQSEPAAEQLSRPDDLISRFSYALGYLQTDSYVSQGIEFNVDYFAAAMRAAVEGTEPMFTFEEMNQYLMEYQEVLNARQQEYMSELGAANLEAAEAYLAENGSREEVVTTESGLQYEVLSEGSGEKPGAEDVVTVHYSGTLIDGTVFDSSYQRGTPATFPLNGVIPGWAEGVQLMSVGASYRFFIPPALGYGDTGAGDIIGPNELLIFDVELLEIGAE